MARKRGREAAPREPSRTMEDVARCITGMKFRRRIFGGVDEADVWAKIEALHREYESVFNYQEARFAVLREDQAAPVPEETHEEG
ncbi:MAG: hypothetical protein IJL66_02440 [Lachnospiraceae bacterium]|nr:hypothetical protein [Lachnospiraceae bacterium]